MIDAGDIKPNYPFKDFINISMRKSSNRMQKLFYNYNRSHRMHRMLSFYTKVKLFDDENNELSTEEELNELAGYDKLCYPDINCDNNFIAISVISNERMKIDYSESLFSKCKGDKVISCNDNFSEIINKHSKMIIYGNYINTKDKRYVIFDEMTSNDKLLDKLNEIFCSVSNSFSYSVINKK